VRVNVTVSLAVSYCACVTAFAATRPVIVVLDCDEAGVVVVLKFNAVDGTIGALDELLHADTSASAARLLAPCKILKDI
jgi:anti-sigma-K factor RskA